jgi:hypothetical protein
MTAVRPIHCHLGVIQRSRRQTAGRRIAYQSCSIHVDDVWGISDYSSRRREHAGHIILLAADVPVYLLEPVAFHAAITERGPRIDSQEGFTIDFALPREVPASQRLLLAAFALKPLVDVGMAGRVDVHVARASDGKPQPHAHAILSQSVLSEHGFGRRHPGWTELMRRDSGRYVRAVIAGRLTLGCQMLGLDVRLDPRSAATRGDFDPEPRIPRSAWVAQRRGKAPSIVTLLNQTRVSRRHSRSALQELDLERQALIDKLPTDELEAGRYRCVRSTFRFAVPHQPKEAVFEQFRKAINRAEPGQFDAVRFGYDPAVGEWMLVDQSKLCFDGEALSLQGSLSKRSARLIIEVAELLGWPTIVVEGDTQFQQMVAAAATEASLPIAVIGGVLGEAATARLTRLGLNYIKRMVARIDQRALRALPDVVIYETDEPHFVIEDAPVAWPQRTPAGMPRADHQPQPFTAPSDASESIQSFKDVADRTDVIEGEGKIGRTSRSPQRR